MCIRDSAKPGHPQTYMPYGLPPAMAVVNALKAAGPQPTREKVLAALETDVYKRQEPSCERDSATVAHSSSAAIATTKG